MRTLKMKKPYMRGDDVKQLQEAIGVKPADGVFGKDMEKAVAAYQEDHGLEADGIADSDTWNAVGVTTGRKIKRRELSLRQRVPNKSENATVGALKERIKRGAPAFNTLMKNTNADIVFKDEEKTGADLLMTNRLAEKLDTLAVLVKKEWSGKKVRVTEAWDENSEHNSRSVHYEGRAADLTVSDRDSRKLGRLAQLAVDAGFDWVLYENRLHVHASVVRDATVSDAAPKAQRHHHQIAERKVGRSPDNDGHEGSEQTVDAKDNSEPNQGDSLVKIPADPTPPGTARKEREKYARDLEKQFAAWQKKDKRSGLDSKTIVAQWMMETRWGRSSLTKKSKNFGNIKGKGPAGSVLVANAWEQTKSGRDITERSHFRKYNNNIEFYADYYKLICKKKRYQKAIGKSGRAYYAALKKAGYATDTNYVNAMMGAYNQLW